MWEQQQILGSAVSTTGQQLFFLTLWGMSRKTHGCELKNVGLVQEILGLHEGPLGIDAIESMPASG